MKTVDIKYGKVGITLDIHNGRITSIISSTTINVKDYFNEENPTMEEKNEKWEIKGKSRSIRKIFIWK